jgi:TolB-like protein/class 3 adenylate cyclase
MTNIRVERRLAAILAADIVGYSRLVEADEARTLAEIRRIRSDLFDPLVAEYRGRIVKLMGDGAILEFSSVVEAVTFAVALQTGMSSDQAGAGPEQRIVFRVGINLGDVVVDGDDLYGDGVNVAARLESLADPGGIYIAENVRKQLAGKTSVEFEDAGERSLKNIAEPVRVFRWVSAARAQRPLTPPKKPSIAVLPFDNMSGQPDDVYFSDGITEDIITGLARFRSLFVIARNSSFAFRGKPVDMAEIGRRLGVLYLLEGSVRRAGERVRITAQLIEASSGAHLWAERYDRRLDDVFTVQDEVARMIVSALVGRIEDIGLKRSARAPTDSLDAYDCLLRGLAYFRGYGDDDNRGPVRCSSVQSRSTLTMRSLTSIWPSSRSRSTAMPPRPRTCSLPRAPRARMQSSSTRRKAPATASLASSISSAAITTWPNTTCAARSSSTRTMPTG